MKIRNKITSASILLFTCSFLVAQVNKQDGGKKIDLTNGVGYDRTSVTYIYLSFQEERYNGRNIQNFPKVTVNDKFNNHNLEKDQVLEAPFFRSDNVSPRRKMIEQKLYENYIPNKMIAKWFNQQSDGSFSMELIKQRGLYDATDADVLKAKNSKRGLSVLQDAGENLIKKSYIFVFDYIGTETWDEYYDRQDEKLYQYALATKTPPRKSTRMYEGYRSMIYAYIYKLNWNDSVSAVFYDQIWQNPSKLKDMRIPVSFVNEFLIDGIRGQQLRSLPQFSDDELYQLLLQNGVERVLIEASKYDEDLRVRTPIFKDKPFRAKIGLKEDVKIDQRFFVYEMQLNADGKKTGVRKGVLRATPKITDNRTVATGDMQPTVFYQESGKKLYPGMLMEQSYDFGLAIAAGWALRSLQGPMFQISYNLSGLVRWPLFRVFVDAQAGSRSAKFGVSTTGSYNLGSYSIQLGVSKEFCILPNIHLEPYVAIQWDSLFVSGLDKRDKQILDSAGVKYGLETWGGTVGLRIPINIFHNLQLIPTVAISTISYSSKNTLFGSKFPNLPRKPGTYTDNSALMGSTVENMRNADNSEAQVVRSPLRWEITLRYKF